MKKQNRIKKNVKPAALIPQPKPRAQREDLAPITIVATPQTLLPGAIFTKRKGGARVVQTGRLNWKSSEFEKALLQGRFLITTLNQFHRLAMELGDRWCDYGAFLEVASVSHLRALRKSIPLYWIEKHAEGRRVTLISLRDNTDGKYPGDRRSAKDFDLLEEELLSRRHLTQEISVTDAGVIAPARLVKSSLRQLQIAYMATHSTPEELSEFCDGMESIVYPPEHVGMESILHPAERGEMEVAK